MVIQEHEWETDENNKQPRSNHYAFSLRFLKEALKSPQYWTMEST